MPQVVKNVGKFTITDCELGKGQFGTVALARPRNELDKMWLACKVIKLQKLSERMQLSLKREISLLSEIKSEHVIGFHGVQRSANNIYIFMQFVNGGDLQ